MTLSKKQVLVFFILLTGFMLLTTPSWPQNRALVWSEEFDYNGLPNADKWTFEEGGGGWGNNEIQYYTKNRTENARVENGNLIIEARKENYGNREYTSARLITKYKGDWLYGRIEVRAKLPGGKGTWPAIWMLPTDWAYGNWPASGEIDIMEHVGYDPSKVYGTIHTQDYNHQLGTQKGGSVTANDFETAFHVYAIEWTASSIEFFVDDQLYYTFRNEGSWQKWPFDKRFHLLLNVAVGGAWGGAQGVDPYAFPQRLTVDYIRVYQDADLSISGPIYLDPGQSATYSATQYPGGNYEWNVPEDAEIIAGQGTSTMSVKWGASDGDISLALKTTTDTSQTSVFVKTVVIPGESVWWFGNLTDGYTDRYSINTTDGSSFLFEENDIGLKINYNTVNPSTWPRFELTLDRPVNLMTHPWCVVNLKTYNLSNSVSLRFDFADVYGIETNATPVFRPTPIVADGNYHLYQHSFTGHWLSSSPDYGKKVDSTRINKMIVYINGGIFGLPDRSDSLWIESIRFQTNPPTGIPLIPNADINLQLYPNPVGDQLTITAEKPIEKVEVYTMTGLNVETFKRLNHLNTSTLKPGVYLIRICTENGQTIRRIIKK